jgi:glycosyltransferase involved in cell wall biosynthesis
MRAQDSAHMDTAIRRRPLRIAVVSETYPPEVNGVARTIGVMVEGLRARGHAIQLVRPRQGDADTALAVPGLETVLKRGIPLPRYQELRMGLPAKRGLLNAWRARPPNVVQVVTEGPLGASAVAAARKLGLPVVSEFHTNFHTYSTHYGFGLISGLIAGYLRRLHNRAHCTLVPTDEMKALLAAAGYRDLAVVGRGIDSSLFNPARRSAGLRASWGAGEHETVALHVGRLAPEKNLRLFVESVRAMQAVDSKLRVVVVGDGPEAAALRAANRDFVFAGMRAGAELAEHYASADAFLFPSLTETFGNVVTEAMASGLAVVAFDYAAARQYIRHRETGMLAPPAAADPFVASAQELAADSQLRERVRAGAGAVARELTWDRVLDDLERALHAVIDRARAARIATGSRTAIEKAADHAPL